MEPTDRMVRDRTVYEPLLGNVNLRSDYAAPSVKALLTIGESYGERDYVTRMILNRRRYWLDYLTTTQRRWQRNTYRPGRARHHDSIAIREKYVRCTR